MKNNILISDIYQLHISINYSLTIGYFYFIELHFSVCGILVITQCFL